ncbi:hypothetical protein D3C71_182680 [compost metagenome]
MRLTAGQRRVQHADIEPSGLGPWIGERKIFIRRAFGEALSVQRDLQMLQPEGAGLAGRELANILRQRDGSGNHAFGVVIALEQKDRDAGTLQPRHLAVEEQADLVVLPVAVINVAGDDEEIDLALDRLIDKCRKGLSACLDKKLGEIGILESQPLERAAEMQVCGMDEAEGTHRIVSCEHIRNARLKVASPKKKGRVRKHPAFSC